ncbi:GNAT family N-acetyltransferase [Micromonospora endolithica]|uniref:GNAT family N-acetyltransferase n=1 Tax=Micromonospora endolithica TaxID=230091 RepID=UPI001EE09167|nr:GNAT family protein [Micromonospora endolithica]
MIVRGLRAYPALVLTPSLPLRTERLDLRPFTASDLAALHAYFSLPELHRYVEIGGPPADLDVTRAVLERRRRRTALAEVGDVVQLAVVLRETGQLVGDVVLIWRSAEHRQGEVGYVLHPDHQGHGYVGEAAAAMLALGFDTFDLHRIVGRIDARNTASARVLERLGMRREAHLRENEMIRGEWTDEVVYAMLAREWHAATGATRPD